MPEKYSKIVHQLEWSRSVFEFLTIAGILMFTEGALLAFALETGTGDILGWLCGIAAVVMVYGSVIEPWFLTVKRFEVGKGANAVTIAFLSDIHVGPYKRERWLARLVRRTNALGADLILLGGDYVYDQAKEASLLGPLAGLRAPLGVYGILGNHDGHYGPEEISRRLEGLGIQMLRNRTVRLTHQGRSIAISGVDDDWFGDTDYEAAARDVRRDDVRIMLIHNPEVASHAAKERPNLMLSGHDHGGQIRLPLLGAIARMPHSLGQKYDRGLFKLDGTPLIIGQGVGESGPRARLFCPPQIVHVTLRF
jgi:hypothetical protein